MAIIVSSMTLSIPTIVFFNSAFKSSFAEPNLFTASKSLLALLVFDAAFFAAFFFVVAFFAAFLVMDLSVSGVSSLKIKLISG